MKTISIKGVVIALCVDNMLSLFIGVALLFIARPAGMASNEFETWATEFTRTTPFLIGALIWGSLPTILAGYIAGKFGKDAPLTNAGLFGMLELIAGLFFVDSMTPVWFSITAFVIVVPGALLGGYIADRRTKGDGLNSVLVLACILGLMVGPILLVLYFSDRPQSTVFCLPNSDDVAIV